jgi:RNA polymerase sigma-70 factor (ECF subfamily)
MSLTNVVKCAPMGLTELLLRSLPPSSAPADRCTNLASLETQLEQVVTAASAAWPGVNLPVEEFLPYLAQRLREGATPADVLNLHAADLYLACACARGDATAIAAFEARCLTVVDQALAPLHVDSDALAEIKQEIRRTLLVADGHAPKITDFAGRGDLRGWLRVMAVRDALSRLRRARRELAADEDLLERTWLPHTNPELELLKSRYRDEFKRAVGEAMSALTPRERTLLRQQFIDGLTIDQLGATYRVHRATAARWLERARQKLQVTTRAALMKRLTVQPLELDSVMRLIQSRLDMSVRAFFRRRPP